MASYQANPQIPRSNPNLPTYLWHHRVHREKAKENLFFWRIGFDPVYERDKVKAAINTTCELHGVGSLVVYELLGVYDLLLRVWLPDGCSFDDFHQNLTHELSSAGLSMLDPFQVEYMVRHWPFFKAGEQQSPAEKAIVKLTPELIERAEHDLTSLDADELEFLETRHLLARTDGSAGDAPAPGIKFVMMVSGDEDLTQKEFEAFENKVEGIFDRAKAIHEKSMYTGSGFGHFLLMGRAGYDQESFHAIHSELIASLNAADLRERFHTRTVTHLGGQRGYSMISERLTGKPVSVLPQRRKAEMTGADDEALQVGQIFANRFEVKEDLGGGGFARVYRVHDIYERVDRALKLFKSNDPKVALREISALRKIDHPNVVKLLWGDRYGSRWFIVCEFIEGKSLREIGGGLSPQESMRIVIQVLVALEAVHPNDERIAELQRAGEEGEMALEVLHELTDLQAKGLIHRDVKPDNVMVREDGRIVLVDFNIASPAKSVNETSKGTPAYFAPEGGYEGWQPTHDLFATGIVLYELLTGHHPYPNELPVAGVKPFDPREYVPEMRESLALLLVKACSSVPEDRYQTAKEMRIVLEGELRILRMGTEGSAITRQFRERRTGLGLTVEDIAVSSGLDTARLLRIESADTQVGLDEALSIQSRLNAAEQAAMLNEKLEGMPGRDGDFADGGGLLPTPPSAGTGHGGDDGDAEEDPDEPSEEDADLEMKEPEATDPSS